MKKIVVLDGYTENPGDLSWDSLQEFGDITVYERTSSELTAQRIRGAEIVLTNKTQISRKIMEESVDLKFVGVLATGYNIVDIEAAREFGITVSNVPDYGTDAVAQFTMALLLELCHHVGKHSESVHQGQWSKCPDFCYWEYPLIELKGKIMGIVGFGRIGRRVAELAQAFGMKVLVCSHHEIPEKYLKGTIRSVSVDEIYRKSDVISLHCPLTEENEAMICRETIEKMKQGVWLINTARGGLIREKELAEALKSGRVGGAAVDVVSSEPITADNELLGCENIIITPHIAWAPREARQRLMDITVENIRGYLLGNPIHVIS